MKIAMLLSLTIFERKPKEKTKNAVSAQLSSQEKQNLPNVRTSERNVLQKFLQAHVWSVRKACAIIGSNTQGKEVANLHELSIACEIFEQVMNTAAAHGATKVKHVTLQMGRLSHTNPEQLSFCFNAIAKESIAEDADFIVEMVPPSLECECGYTGPIDEKQIQESNELTSELLAYIEVDKECPICGKQAQTYRRQRTDNKKH